MKMHLNCVSKCAYVPILVIFGHIVLSALVPQPDGAFTGDQMKNFPAATENEKLAAAITKEKDHLSGLGIITDLKLDDQLLIACCISHNPSLPINIFVTGIKDQEGGVATTDDMLKGMFPEGKKLNIRYILADEPAKERVNHELNFMEKNPGIKTYFLKSYLNEIENYPEEKFLLIQCGPMPAENAYSIIKAYGKRSIAYILIAMFNAGQGDPVKTMEFLNTIQFQLNSVFYNGEKDVLNTKMEEVKIPLLFSDNYSAFSERGLGSTLDFEKLIPYVPAEHLIKAAKDPFHWWMMFGALNRVKIYYMNHGTDDPTEELSWVFKTTKALYRLAMFPNFQEGKATDSDSKILSKVNDLLVEIKLEEIDRMKNAGDELPKSQMIIKLAERIDSLFEGRKTVDFEDFTEWGIPVPTTEDGKDIAIDPKKLGEINPLEVLGQRGEVYKQLILSAKMANGEIGKTLQKEFYDYCTALANHPAINRADERFHTYIQNAVRPGFKKFSIEACDGMHIAVWFNQIFKDGKLQSNINQILRGQTEKIVRARFTINQQYKNTKVEKIDPSNKSIKSTGFKLDDADSLEPQTSLLKFLDGKIKKQRNDFSSRDFDPFEVANVKISSKIFEMKKLGNEPFKNSIVTVSENKIEDLYKGERATEEVKNFVPEGPSTPFKEILGIEHLEPPHV